MSQSPDPTQPPPPPPASPTPGVVTVEEAKNLAMFSHIFNFILLVPLIIYLLKKGQNAFLDGEAREALNFSITCAIAYVVLMVLAMSLFVHLFMLLRGALLIAQIVLGVMGGLKARDGIPYQYPVNIRLIK